MPQTQWWFDYPITNPHSSDDGVDLGTPNDTLVEFPYPGQVIDANYYTYGGQVVVNVPGAGFDEYFIHLDKIYAKKGDTVKAGDVVGATGGGIGDLLLKNGIVQPATSQADYLGASTGYHTEFGEFKDTSAHGDMAQFNEGWGGQGGKQNGRQLDPTAVIEQLQQAQNQNTPWWAQFFQNPALAGGQAGIDAASAAAASPANPANWATDAIKSLGFSSSGDMFSRVGATIGGMVLIALGLFVAFQPEAQAAIAQVRDSTAEVVGKAAKAAAL